MTEKKRDEHDIIEFIPESFRSPTKAMASFANFLTDRLRGEPPGLAWGYLDGALTYQETLRDTSEGHESKFFRVTLKDLRVEQRGGGEKAVLIWDGKDFKSGKPKEETIDTGYLKHFDYDSFAFEIALANTLYDLAERLVGKDVLIRKAFTLPNHAGDRFRYLADLRPAPKLKD